VPEGDTDFTPIDSIQTASGFHHVSYTMGLKGLW